MNKLIINAAITGMIPTKETTPHVPITPDEIADDARRCRDAGASIVHLHARDEYGIPTYRKDIYEQILRKVREACPDIILCVSTSGRMFKSFEERSQVLDAVDPQTEMASLTLGSMNFPKVASVNSPDMIKSLALRMHERGIVPEWECFELGMAEYSNYLIDHSILYPPFYCNILLGSLGTLSATPENLRMAVNALHHDVTWAAAGIGRYQLSVNKMAISMGGHVRIGLEDNIWYDDERTHPASNVELIERIVQIAKSEGREPASPAEAREIIGIK
ncbi:MAG: beta-keto acid cleavage family enzyme [Armatimonadota bacterium]